MSAQLLALAPSALCAQVISSLVKHYHAFMWHEDTCARLDSPQTPSQIILAIVVEKQIFQGYGVCAAKLPLPPYLKKGGINCQGHLYCYSTHRRIVSHLKNDKNHLKVAWNLMQ